MAVMNFHPQSPMHPQFKNNPYSSTTRPAFNLFPPSSSATSSAVSVFTMPEQPITAPPPIKSPPKPKAATKPKTSKAVSVALLKDLYLDSLSTCSDSEPDPASEWVLGIDPDICGALALIRPDRTVEVFDAPHIKVPVGKSVRRRLDAKSIVKLIQSFNAPIGTTVYLEQSIPCPQDGKQGWWCMGLGYGMWIGILVASGFSVVPVSSMSWKNEFQLPGSRSGKDASRELASALFPSMSSLLTRKKDHGRAEALLIAAYGKGLKLMSRASSTMESKSL